VYDRGMQGFGDLAAFVLAGGKSSRMGVDKAFLEYRSRTLLSCALELAASLSPSVWIVGSREKFGGYCDVVEDLFPGRGPLGGIHAALRSSHADLNLMMAVDMPLLSQQFLEYLIARARSSEATVIAPRTDGRWQPLCAVYRLDFAALAEEALQAGRNKIDPLFAMTDTLTLEEDELNRKGFSSALFRNLNTRQEFLELGEEKRT
jgi:molybdenum cofactor guanylyltransferase